MAKQSGLHQIRGKIGEHSYYRQTGVSAGLIRSINQGMSARVKNGPEYANTRLNNREFGAACDVAGLLGKLVVPKFRPMILPFSQSRMAKAVLEVAREHTQNWGERVVTSADTSRLCDILTAQSKHSLDDYATVDVTHATLATGEALVSITPAQASLMLDAGANAMTLYATVYNVATGQWIPLAEMMTTGYIEQVDRGTILDQQDIDPDGINTSETVDVGQFIPASGHAGHQIIVFILLPLRQINEQYHVLQELCSFKALPIPAAGA